jgi:hypothetical protein
LKEPIFATIDTGTKVFRARVLNESGVGAGKRFGVRAYFDDGTEATRTMWVPAAQVTILNPEPDMTTAAAMAVDGWKSLIMFFGPDGEPLAMFRDAKNAKEFAKANPEFIGRSAVR